MFVKTTEAASVRALSVLSADRAHAEVGWGALSVAIAAVMG